MVELSPALVGGRRHHKSAKRVSAKTIRRTLKRLGMRPKGRLVLKGGNGEVVEGEKREDDMGGGRRRRRHGGRSASASMSSSKKGKRSRRRSKRALSIPGLGKLPF